jgi:hypothetical protein
MTKPLRYPETPASPVRVASGCKWPLGDPGEKDFRFCGDPARSGGVYCVEHDAAAHAPTRRLKLR